MNYCHERCEYSLLKKDEAGVVQGRNKGDFCDLGYTQSVNSVKARINAEASGTKVCAKLRSKFRSKTKKGAIK